MQRTGDTLVIRVGDDKTPITLTDSAVEAVQEEAAGKLVDALSGAWQIEQAVPSGEGFTWLQLEHLLKLRDHLATARELVDVLIECRPLDEVEVPDGAC